MSDHEHDDHAEGLPAGPYNHTHTTTYEIKALAAPIVITVTRDVKSSHQPMPCQCSGDDGHVHAKLDQIIEYVERAVPILIQAIKGPGDPGSTSH